MARNYVPKTGLAAVLMLLLFGCSNPQEQLFTAVQEGNIQSAVKALKRGADINKANEEGSTAFMKAAASGDTMMTLNLIRPVIKTAITIDEFNFLSAYKLAAENGHEDTASLLIEEFSTSEGIDSPERLVSAPDGADLRKRASLKAEAVVHLPKGSKITLKKKSLIETEVENEKGHWVSVSAIHEGDRETGWLFDAYITDVQETKPGPINRKMMIDTRDGLKMRDTPGLGGTAVTVIPGGDTVLLLSEEGDEVTIDGRTGQWSEVDWSNERGWVFGGYLGRVMEEKAAWVAHGTQYLAKHEKGVYGTDAGQSVDEEIFFPDGNKVQYSRTVHLFGGYDIYTHEGIFYYEGDRVILVLGQGSKKEVVTEDAGYTPPENPPPVPGFTLTLLWRDDEEELSHGITSFIKLEDFERIQAGDYELDHAARQYKSRKERDIDSIGYFHQTSK